MACGVQSVRPDRSTIRGTATPPNTSLPWIGAPSANPKNVPARSEYDLAMVHYDRGSPAANAAGRTARAARRGKPRLRVGPGRVRLPLAQRSASRGQAFPDRRRVAAPR